MKRLVLTCAVLLIAASASAQVNLPLPSTNPITPAPFIGGGGVPIGPIVAATGCTAPPYTFAGSLTSGICSAATDSVSQEAGGSEVTRATTTGLDLGALSMVFGSAIGTPYASILGQAANVLGVRADASHGVGLSLATDGQMQLLTRAGADSATFRSSVGLHGLVQILESSSSGLTFAASLGGSNHAKFGSTADGLFRLMNSANAGAQINVGTAAPTVTSCGTGSVTANSSNTAGEITATGATACTVTFGAPNWTNTPFCVIEDETTAVAQRISAISTSAFTVTGLTSGDKFMYHCLGGI